MNVESESGVKAPSKCGGRGVRSKTWKLNSCQMREALGHDSSNAKVDVTATNRSEAWHWQCPFTFYADYSRKEHQQLTRPHLRECSQGHTHTPDAFDCCRSYPGCRIANLDAPRGAHQPSRHLCNHLRIYTPSSHSYHGIHTQNRPEASSPAMHTLAKSRRRRLRWQNGRCRKSARR